MARSSTYSSQDGQPRQILAEPSPRSSRSGAARHTLDVAAIGMGVTAIDGQWLSANAALCSMLGRPRESLLATTLQAVTHPDDAEDAAELLRLGEPGVEWCEREKRLLHGSGAVVRVRLRMSVACDGGGRPLHLIWQAQPVDERPRLLSAAEPPLFQALIDAVPDLVVVHRDNRILYLNTTARAMLGRGREETVTSLGLRDLVDADDHQSLASHLEGLTSRGERGPPAEIRLVRPGRDPLATEIISAPVLFAGQPAILSNARDITARRQTRVHHLQKDRLTALGALAAGVAHEIGDPLTFVLHNLDLVARTLNARADDCRIQGLVNGTELAERLDDLAAALGAARQGTDRAQRVSRDLTTFARSGDPRRSLLDVRAVLRPVLHLMSNEIRQRALLVEDYQAVPLVNANEAQLGQMFVNLLINATHAICEGSPGEHEITVSTDTDASGRAIVEVRDTGAGIPEEALRRVFEPFFRARPGGVGTGLGLSICHGAVTALGGEISVRSERGRGSVFRVAIPPADRSASTGKPSKLAPATDARARILLIDGDPRSGEILRQPSGAFELLVLSDAREALERILDGDRFDVILCNLMMPITTGMDLHAELSRSAPGQADRMVFITGGVDTERTRAFLARIPNARLESRPSPARLAELIQEARGRA